MVKNGSIFQTTSDTETIVQLIAKSKRLKTIDKIIDAIFQIQGGYALVMLTQNLLVGVRDPYGIRPLVIGKLKNSYVLASETCALDIIGAKFIREVDNGEIVLIENDKLKSIIDNRWNVDFNVPLLLESRLSIIFFKVSVLNTSVAYMPPSIHRL